MLIKETWSNNQGPIPMGVGHVDAGDAHITSVVTARPSKNAVNL